MTTTPRRLVMAERREEDAADSSLRPQRLAEFIGQQQARSNLAVFIEAARTRRSRRPAIRGVPRARRAISLAPSAVIPMPSTRAPRLTISSSSLSE